MPKILIVDDDPNIRHYLAALFEDHGYVTVAAGDVSEALQTAQDERPDLITLDLDLPGEWGPRFYRSLSQDPELKSIPIIVISAMPGSRYAIGNAVASFNKPFDREELLKTVGETLNP
ncbi:MAG: response regulator [Desulfohalobiaceae bacterium]|nr:response regulator [Desulfohalobiaceae bacterium]